MAALAALNEDDVVLDGEIVVSKDGRPDFDALLRRIHPAARHVERMALEAPAPYEPGRRSMIKVKLLRIADCVVAGCRILSGGRGISTLLLGLYDDDARLHHVGVASSFTAARRRELVEEVRPYVVDLADHPWRDGFAVEGGSMGRRPVAGRRT